MVGFLRPGLHPGNLGRCLNIWGNPCNSIVKNGDLTMKHGNLTMKHGDLTVKKCNLTMKKYDLTMKKGK